MTDAERLKRWYRNREDSDLKYFYDKYYKYVVMATYKNTGDMNTSKDILQSLWVRIFFGRPIELKGNFGKYLLGAARNARIDFKRRSNLDFKPLSEFPNHIDHHTPQSQLESIEIKKTIDIKGKEFFYDDLIANYKEPKKTVAKEIYYKNASNHEIAESHNISLKRVTLYRSRIKDDLANKIRKAL